VHENPTGRFERQIRVADPDAAMQAPGDGVQHRRTEIADERPRSAITRNTSPDVPFDRSINPYRGCEHGCVYCFARPSHAYLGLSPGLDFETRLIARPGMVAVLAEELRRPSYRVAPIAIGTNTDPYQPIERTRGIMRSVLEVLSEFRHPVSVTTKGRVILRDLDLLGEMGQAGLAAVGVSVTTLDPDLARRMEPRCPAPAHRLAMIEALAAAGCPVRLMVAPLVPGLSDHELEAILRAGREAGATAARLIPLRLPREVAGMWHDWLAAEYPDRVGRVMSKLRDMHGGRAYDPAWGRRMTGTGIWADLLRQRFRRAVRALGYTDDLPTLRCDLFAPPPRPGDQLALF
jgi:DNA repair photolyase